MPRIAIMQGRLLPPQGGRFQCFPRDGWREEFALAAEAGLDAIEWIYDLHGVGANPIASDEGVLEMRKLAESHGVAVASLCADYFMDRPFVNARKIEFEKLGGILIWLIGRCRAAGIGRLVLPFVDASRIDTDEQEARIAVMLRCVQPHARQAGVEIHLETSLNPEEFGGLLAKLPQTMLRANYDSGNSASLGYDLREELAAYGPRIGSVHIKDRVRGGGTVPLGTGAADVPALLAGLAALGYQGDYVLQVARGVPGSEVAWARHNREWLAHRLEEVDAVVTGGAR